MKKQTMVRYLLGAVAIGMIASFEFLPHPVNFVPVTAAAIFSGMYFSRPFALALSIGSLFVADLFQGISWIDVPFVYGSIAFAAVLGGWLGRQSKTWFVAKLTGITLTSSIIFFVVTNLGVWLFQNLYSKDFSGLVQCYVMAIPFFKNSMLGDLLFTMSFVACYEGLARLLQVRPGMATPTHVAR